MKRMSTAQEYYTLMIDKNGLMPAMYKAEAGAGLVAAAFLELLVNDIISVENKKITVRDKLPENMEYLGTLYTYLQEKTRTMEKMVMEFYSGRRNRELVEGIGETLCEEGAAVEKKGGVFGPKRLFIPSKDYKEALVEELRTAVREDELTPREVALIYLLEEAKCLKQYFSKYESDQLKEKLKEIKKDPMNRRLAQMIDYVDDITDIITVLLVTTMN